MNSCELVLFVSTTACAISECHTKEELALLSTVFMQLGDSLATIVANEDLKEARCSSSNQNNTTKTEANTEANTEENVKNSDVSEASSTENDTIL